MKKNIGAFFDIDGTLYRDSLLIEHFKKLIKYEVVNPKFWYSTPAKETFDEWDDRKGAYDTYLRNVCDAYVSSLIGVNEEKISFIKEQVIKLTSDKVYKFTRNKIKEHLELGHKVFFISGSPEYLVEGMAKKYNVTDYVGAKYLLDENGNYTGEVVPMYDHESKLQEINKFAKQYNIDLSESFSYGDTYGDITMFEQVGNATAINPNKKLYEYIKETTDLNDKTQIVIERKDNIYILNLKNNTFEIK